MSATSPHSLRSADLGLSESTASENDTVTLNGQFHDPGTLDQHTVTIDWGDGSSPTVLLDLLGQVTESPTPGLFTYAASHHYLNNPVGQPTGGTYDIHVSIADDVTSASTDRLIVVNNVAPTVRIASAGSVGSGTIRLTAVVTDPGTLDTETLAWTLEQNGTVILTGTGPSFTFASPSPIGVLVATATATDSDGAAGHDNAQVALITDSGATIVIDPDGITVSIGGSTVSTTPSAGAGEVIALVYGSNNLVDASAESTPVELDGYGSNESLVGGSGNDVLVANTGSNSLAGGLGDDTLVSNKGCDSLFGGAGNDVFRINPGSDPLVNDTGGSNTLDFSIASLGITINLGMDTGQTQVVDSSSDVVALQGQFDDVHRLTQRRQGHGQRG